MMNLFDRNENELLSRDLFGLHFPNPFGFTQMTGISIPKNSKIRHFAFVEIGPLTSVEEPIPAPTSIWGKIRSVILAGLRIIHPTGDALSVKEAIAILAERKPHCLVAANLCPSRTSIDGESITRDIVKSFDYMYDFADMFIIDTFRKNADGSVPLQNVDLLSEVLDALLKIRISNDTVKPIFIRVENGVQDQNLADMLDYMRYSGIDAIIAGHDTSPAGLVKRIVGLTQGRYPVIACGNIQDPDEAQNLLDSGACLLQFSGKCRTIMKTLAKRSHTK